jgi:hypothetical protein
MKVASLKRLAASDNPFDDEDQLVQRLRRETKESLHLEWKLQLPLGPATTKRNKYRVVKAVLSFANWDGGFVLFGVGNDGVWRGLDEADLVHIDPAKLAELVNGCAFPDLPHLGYHEFRWRGKRFAVVHTPPSNRAPHVTTRDVYDQEPGRKHERLIQRFALYCRRGGQSDLATPAQHHELLSRKTDRVRDELVRRIREVPVPVLSGAVSTRGGGPMERGVLVVRRAAEDSSAPAVRLTRGEQGTAGVLVHEELADGLFDEINNVLDANALLASGEERFVFGEPVYYRVYAERQHVISTGAHPPLLARTGLCAFYAPHLFWLLHLNDAAIARLLADTLAHRVHPRVLASYCSPRDSARRGRVRPCVRGNAPCVWEAPTAAAVLLHVSGDASREVVGRPPASGSPGSEASQDRVPVDP